MVAMANTAHDEVAQRQDQFDQEGGADNGDRWHGCGQLVLGRPGDDRAQGLGLATDPGRELQVTGVAGGEFTYHLYLAGAIGPIVVRTVLRWRAACAGNNLARIWHVLDP